MFKIKLNLYLVSKSIQEDEDVFAMVFEQLQNGFEKDAMF